MAPTNSTRRLRHSGLAKGTTLRENMYAQVGRLLRSAPSEQLEAAWRPNPAREPGAMSPQELALETDADETAYGGRAGGGKTSWLVGTPIRGHHKAIIFRREFGHFTEIDTQVRDILGNLGRWNSTTRTWSMPMGKRLRFGACQREKDVFDYQGDPHDYIGFDELCQWPESMFVFLCGWNRSSRPGQRCRVCVTFNPPTNAEGAWVIDRYAPWLDQKHPNPATPGELRWFVRVKSRDTEVQPRFYADVDGRQVFTDDDHGGQVVTQHSKLPRLILNGQTYVCRPAELVIDGEPYLPSSRTFVPAGMDDNPFIGPEYRAKVDAMPEPLRTQLKYGDFGAGRLDDPWQCIPSAWVDAAMERWKRRTVDLGAAGVRRPVGCETLHQVGVDVARDGVDEAVIARRYGNWADMPIYVEKDVTAPKGQQRTGGYVGRRVQLSVDPGADPVVLVDLINVGTSPVDWLRENTKLNIQDFVASARSQPNRTTSGGLTFNNDRSLSWWNLRELLDPAGGHDIMLPPSSKLRADLCAPRFEVRAGCIHLEPKDKIHERLGRSPDTGDAYVLAFMEELVPTLSF